MMLESRLSALMRAWSLKGLYLGAAVATLCACAAPRPACSPEYGASTLVFELFFGRQIAGGSTVTENDWQAFIDRTVSTHLPNGYTVLDADGAWINPVTRKTIREATKVVLAALPDSPENLAKVNQIRVEYPATFRQQLVGMIVHHACSSF